MGIVIAVIVAYMALMLFIGWRASKSVKSSKILQSASFL